MTDRKFLRSVLALLLVVASLVGMLPAVFAAETEDKQQVTVYANDLVDEGELDEALLDSLYEQYGLNPQEQEDSEFGTPQNIDPEAKGDTKDDAISTTYVFLDMKPGQSSRNFNWQMKTDSAKDQYFSANIQGCLAGYFQGSDARLYMPIELGSSYIDGRLKQYVLKAGDIARVRVQSITENDTFVSGGTATVNSYFAVHTSGSSGAWQDFGSNQKLGCKTVEQTLTWTVNSGLVGQTLRGVRWDPSQSDIPETRIYIDYIYIGPASSAPVKVEYRNETNSGNLGYHYVGYGKKANAFSTGQTNTEDTNTQTIWGWQVHEKQNGSWVDLNKFVTDPTTYTCKYDTRFVLKKVTIRKENLNSTQTYNNGISAEDDKYVLTVDGFDTAEMTAGGHGTPLDIAILLDHSGSQAELVTNNKCTTAAQVTEKVANISHAVQPGYYRATCFRQKKHDGTSTPGFDGYIYTMPMRYYRGKWQMQALISCTCNTASNSSGAYHNNYGVYPFYNSMKPCSHVKWVSMEEGFEAFKTAAKNTGYTVGSTYTINGKSEKLQFNFGASRLGRAQNALVSFCASVYNSSHNLPAGTTHTISVLGYGSTIFADKYPFNNNNGTAASNYITTSGKNYSACTKASTAVDVSNYESIIKAIRDTYCFGATRTDFAFQVLTGTQSDFETKIGLSSTTLMKTDYLPASKAGRKRVVVLMTDGEPSSNLDFSSDVATKAIKASKTLKADSRTTVYALGILDDLDDTKYYSTSNSNMNNFMNLISSRYPEATAYNVAGSKKVTGAYYIADTSSGSELATQMGKIWTGTSASLAASGKSGPGSLWLYEDFGREWKPDTAANVKIWAAPYTGNGTYGAKVLIGEHKVTDNTKNQDFAGNGYILHYYYDAADQSFTYALQWTDAKTAFLRETELSTGSKAIAKSGALNTKKGYKVFMEMPIEVDRNNTLGGNNIPLTTSASGCYQAKAATDQEIGTKLYSYVQPNANVPFFIDDNIQDYEISLEDYEKILSGEIPNGLEYVLKHMVRLPENLKVVNEAGLSMVDYLSFTSCIRAQDGTMLCHRAVDMGATSLKTNVYNIENGIVDLSEDHTFTLETCLNYGTHNVDSYGREPYPSVNSTMYGTYIAPEITEEPTEPTEEPTEPSEEPTEPEEPAAPEVVEELKPYHSLNLQSNISINYVVPVDVLNQYDSYEIKCYVADKLSTPKAEERDGYVYFILTDINALQMNVMVRAELYAYKDGKTYVSPLDSYSIVTYATNMMSRAVPEQVKRMCANLLRYGAASQLYMGYDVENLADAGLTEEQKGYLVDLDTVEFENHYAVLDDLNDPKVTWAGKTLMLDSTVAIKLAVDASGYEGNAEDLELRFTYTDIDGEERVGTAKATVYNAERKLYMFVIDQLEATELRTVLYCQVFAGDEAVSQTMTYSADSYCNGKTGALLELCKALFAYVDEARAYFGG